MRKQWGWEGSDANAPGSAEPFFGKTGKSAWNWLNRVRCTVPGGTREAPMLMTGKWGGPTADQCPRTRGEPLSKELVDPPGLR